MEVEDPMKKALAPLALALALTAPIVDAARVPGAPDGDLIPFETRNLSPARDIAALAGLERDGGYRVLVVGAAVPGAKEASCQARVVGPRGRVILASPFVVEAGSTAQIDFADRIGTRVAAGAQVSCDQPFYSYAAAAGKDEVKATWGEAFGPNAPCDFEVTAAELSPGVFVATKDGTIHSATTSKPKGVVCIKVPKDLAVEKMIMEWDVIRGPWSKVPSGNHNMIFLHRGRFRSNTVSNVNAFGPKKNFIKAAQNVDLPARYSTNQKLGTELKEGVPYNLRYIYDAADKKVALELYERDALVKTINMAGSAKNRLLIVDATGLSPKGSLFAEFGHFKDQHPPEMPSFGWRYSNLRVEMHVKK
jgi:hypothetical protein